MIRRGLAGKHFLSSAKPAHPDAVARLALLGGARENSEECLFRPFTGQSDLASGLILFASESDFPSLPNSRIWRSIRGIEQPKSG
jgi:hypothetical protein